MRVRYRGFERVERAMFYLLLLLLPTQLGKHFWPDFAIISGIRIDYLSPTLYVTDILVGFLFVIWLVNTVYSSQFTVQNYRAKLTIFSVVLLLLLLNIFLSQNYLHGLYHLLKFLEFSFVAYYIATTVICLEQVKKLFLLLAVGVIGQSFLAIAQFIKQGSLNGILYFFGERLFISSTPGIANASINGELLLRPYGTFPHPNVLAGFLLFVMVGLLFFFPGMKGFVRGVAMAALLLGSSALLLTMSRVAIVVWILLLLFVLFLSLRAVAKQSLLGLPRRLWLLAMTMMMVSSLIFFTPFGSRLIQTNLTEEAVVTRIDLMTASWQLFNKEPVIGVGFGNFLPQLATIATPLPLNLYLQPVHNIFLLVLAETGAIGFVAFVGFLVVTYWRLFHLAAQSSLLSYRLCVILLTVVLILGLFDHYFLTLQQGQLLFALIVGLCWVRIKA